MEGWTWRLRAPPPSVPSGPGLSMHVEMKDGLLCGRVDSMDNVSLRLIEEVSLRRDSRKRRARTSPSAEWAAFIQFGSGVCRGGVVADRCVLQAQVEGDFQLELPSGLCRSWCWSGCEGERRKIWYVEHRYRVVILRENVILGRTFCVFEGGEVEGCACGRREVWRGVRGRRVGGEWQREEEGRCLQVGERVNGGVFVEEVELRDEMGVAQVLVRHVYKMGASYVIGGGISADFVWGRVGEIRHRIEQWRGEEIWKWKGGIGERVCVRGNGKGGGVLMVWGGEIVEGVGWGGCRRRGGENVDFLRMLAYERGGSLKERAEGGLEVLKDVVTAKEDDCCPICLEGGGGWVRLPCLHGGHAKCIAACLKRKMICPVCRMQLGGKITMGSSEGV